jgi:hypothetical protein
MAYFFIGGAPRSGGTLLASILCADKTVNPLLRETHYLREQVQLYKRCKTYFKENERRNYFADEEDLRSFTRQWVLALLDKIRDRYKPIEHLVLKSFPMTFEFPELYELLPEAYFLVTLRDPRDGIASQVEVGEKQAKAGQNVRFPRDTHRLACEYQAIYSSCVNTRDAAFKSRILYVKYEDLVGDTEKALARIRDFTGLSLAGFDSSKDWQSSQRDFRNGVELTDPYTSQLYGQGISKQRIHRFKEVLTPGEIKLIERGAASYFQHFGYPV